MKSVFWEYYRPSVDEFQSLFADSIVVLDASALLHAYRLSPDASDTWLNLLEAIADRVWVPHQAALEYARNRLATIAAHRNVIAEVNSKIDKHFSELTETIESLETKLRRTRVIDPEDLTAIIGNARGLFTEPLAAAADAAIDWAEAQAGADRIAVRIDEIVGESIGSPYRAEDLAKLFKEGKQRFAEEVPPGWKDAAKSPDQRRYGDLILWKQTIDEAEKRGAPVALVTEDGKEDWWLTAGGMTVGPQPQLRREFHDAVRQHVWLYSVAGMMARSEDFGGPDLNEAAVQDAQAFADAEEEIQKARAVQKQRVEKLIQALEIIRDDEGISTETESVLQELIASVIEAEL